jgi:hypothetical protein
MSKVGATKFSRILATNVSGFAWPLEAWERGLAWEPDVISAQGTTLDDGAFLLGSSKMYTRGGRLAFRRAMELILAAVHDRHIPAVFSCGDSGHDIGLEGALRVIDDVTTRLGIRLRFAVISGELSKAYVLEKLDAGAEMRRLVDHPALVPLLTAEEVNTSEHIVAQMGPEPIMRALRLDVDGVIVGRALDEAPHMALPLLHGFDRGVVGHMAKIAETAQSGGTWRAPHLITLHEDNFLIRPAAADTRCTTTSVASVALYERSSPNEIGFPGGVLHLDQARYEQVDDVTVRVSGGRWSDSPYCVKLEGARLAGYRCLGIAGARDPAFLASIESILATVERELARSTQELSLPSSFRHCIRVFGRDGVMGSAEPVKESRAHELGIVVDVVSPDPEVARAVCYRGLHTLLMCSYPERKTTSGNVAWVMSPEVIEAGEAYEFSIHHLMPISDPSEPFRTTVVEFPRRSS